MHLRNSWPRSTSICCIRRLPSASRGGGANAGSSVGLLVVEGDVGDQVADHREGAQRRDRDDLVLARSPRAGVMHISRGLPLISALHDPHLPALQFQRTARSPAWVRLHAVDDVEHDLALVDLDRVVLELAAGLVAAPDPQLQRGSPSGLASSGSSKYFFSSSGITGNGFSCRSTPVAVGVRGRPRGSWCPTRRRAREVVAGVAAAGLLARQRRLGDALADEQHVAQVERQVPAGVVLPVPLHDHRLSPAP